MNKAHPGGEEDGKRRPHFNHRYSTPEPRRSSQFTSTTIIADLSAQVDRLARVETQLAARELTRKAGRNSVSDTLLSLAMLFALYGGAALVTCLVIVLALVIPLWVAALVAAVGLAAISGLLLVAGKTLR